MCDILVNTPPGEPFSPEQLLACYLDTVSICEVDDNRFLGVCTRISCKKSGSCVILSDVLVI